MVSRIVATLPPNISNFFVSPISYVIGGENINSSKRCVLILHESFFTKLFQEIVVV